MIDPEIFLEPSWMLTVEELDTREVDHARLLADLHRDPVNALGSVVEKFAYLRGVLDAQVTVVKDRHRHGDGNVAEDSQLREVPVRAVAISAPARFSLRRFPADALPTCNDARYSTRRVRVSSGMMSVWGMVRTTLSICGSYSNAGCGGNLGLKCRVMPLQLAKWIPCSALISMMRAMSGPDGFANSVAQRVKNVSNPEGAVVINMRSGSSPTFLKACTEFLGMKAAAPGLASCHVPSVRKLARPASTKNHSSSFVCQCGGGPAPGGVVSTHCVKAPPVCSPVRWKTTSSPKA